MKRKIILPALLSLSILGACQKKHKCQSYNSEIVSETVSLEDFNKIDLEMEANIVYTQGTEQSVVIEAPEKLMEYISTSVFQNTLKIKMENRFCFRNSKPIKIYITTPDLNNIEIDGSGNFLASNHLITENLFIKIRGSGDFYADSISTTYFSTDISGSGDIYIAGNDTISKQTIKISGSGDINSSNIRASESVINISGSGNCKVYVLDNLDVKISGSGDVRYDGNPTLNIDITGSGNVKQN